MVAIPTAAGHRATLAGHVATSGQSVAARTFASLAIRDFRYLWLGNVLLFIGSAVRMVASGYLAYDLTSSPLVLGVVSVGYAVPMLLMSPLGGALADRLDRRRIVQAAQLAFAVTAAAVAFAIFTETITWWHLFAASALQGGIWSSLVPARQAMVPHIVGKPLMTNGLALVAGGFSASTLIGPALGGVIYAWAGAATTYLVVTGFGLAAVVLTGGISAEGGASQAVERRPVWAGAREAIIYVSRDRTLLLLWGFAVGYALLAMPFRMILPVFVVDLYGRGPEALGILSSALGLGSLAAALAVAGLPQGRRGIILASGGLLGGVSILLIAAVPVFLVGLGMMVAVGVADALRKALNQALALELSDPAFHGRVTSLFMLAFALVPLGSLPATALAEWLGGRAAGAALGLGLLVVSLAVLSSRHIRSLK